MTSRLPKPRRKMKYPELWMHKGSGDLILHYDNSISVRYRDSKELEGFLRLDVISIAFKLDAWDAGFMSRDDRKVDTKHFLFIGEIR